MKKKIVTAVIGMLLAFAAAAQSTCSGKYPSYFQDPAFAPTGMWDDQAVINQPPRSWRGPVFKLSDAYGRARPETTYPWSKFNPFDPKLGNAERSAQAEKYIWALMAYMQAGNADSGNVDTDWTLCGNKVRQWFHIPYQTYEPLSGREFVHGLTREAPVAMQINGGKQTLKTTVWAVGFYNPAAAQSISKVWTGANAPSIPTENFKFNEGSVIGKLLFTTANANQFPFLANMPTWRANISGPEFCACKASDPSGVCTFKEQTEQCPRNVGEVALMQFDVAVRDSRSPVGWAYGTFVADGQRRAGQKNPWNRIAPLGLMWGNDTPPVGTLASTFPVDMRKDGSKDSVIFWDVVDELNKHTNAGHLGCSNRLNGPADNSKSSCLSCHQTASVPDSKGKTPAIIAQFGSLNPGNGQCFPQSPDKDRTALSLRIDQAYLKTLVCSSSFTGPADIVPVPDYKSGAKDWVSTDFSLQLSISLVQWQEWDRHQKENGGKRAMKAALPAR
jgi:hypothetical protein